MARKIDTIGESLEFLRGHPWNYESTFEVYDVMLQSISDAVRSATCEALTRASIQQHGGSWSVVLELNRDPEVFRNLCDRAIEIDKERKWAATTHTRRVTS